MAKFPPPSSSLIRSFGRSTAALAVTLVLATGCSGGEVQAERIPQPTAIPAPASVDAQGQSLTLTVVDGGEATGLVITDSRGFAVYGNTGESVDELVCVDDCTNVWIPVQASGASVAAELDSDLLGVFARPDGLQQATYGDVPLYTWTGDDDVGITAGAGVAGTWFALTETAGFVAEQ